MPEYTRVPKPKVGDPIIFRVQPDGPERVVRPCSKGHRELWLSGYVVASCSKCCGTLAVFPDSATYAPEGNKE